MKVPPPVPVAEPQVAVAPATAKHGPQRLAGLRRSKNRAVEWGYSYFCSHIDATFGTHKPPHPSTPWYRWWVLRTITDLVTYLGSALPVGAYTRVLHLTLTLRVLCSLCGHRPRTSPDDMTCAPTQSVPHIMALMCACLT